MLQLSICGRKKQSHGKKLWVETKAHKCISLVTAGGMLAIKLSRVREQTQSGFMAVMLCCLSGSWCSFALTQLKI